MICIKCLMILMVYIDFNGLHRLLMIVTILCSYISGAARQRQIQMLRFKNATFVSTQQLISLFKRLFDTNFALIQMLYLLSLNICIVSVGFSRISLYRYMVIALRCDVMRCDALRCVAMRCDAKGAAPPGPGAPPRACRARGRSDRGAGARARAMVVIWRGSEN